MDENTAENKQQTQSVQEKNGPESEICRFADGPNMSWCPNANPSKMIEQAEATMR